MERRRTEEEKRRRGREQTRKRKGRRKERRRGVREAREEELEKERKKTEVEVRGETVGRSDEWETRMFFTRERDRQRIREQKGKERERAEKEKKSRETIRTSIERECMSPHGICHQPLHLPWGTREENWNHASNPFRNWHFKSWSQS